MYQFFTGILYQVEEVSSILYLLIDFNIMCVEFCQIDFLCQLRWLDNFLLFVQVWLSKLVNPQMLNQPHSLDKPYMVIMYKLFNVAVFYLLILYIFAPVFMKVVGLRCPFFVMSLCLCLVQYESNAGLLEWGWKSPLLYFLRYLLWQ